MGKVGRPPGITGATEATERKVVKVLESLSMGCTISAACKAANLDRSTYYDWINYNEENKEKHYDALDMSTDCVESALYKSAIDPDQHNTTAKIFWLTNRRPDKWKHKQVQEIQANITNHSSILDELEDDE